MGWIKQIRDKIGTYLLQGMAVKKTNAAQALPSYNSIHEIGIVYDAGNKKQEEQVNKIAQILRSEGKKVMTLGFVNAPKLPYQNKFHISSEYYWQETLTFFNLPEKAKIGRFLESEFDLLMNLFFEKELPLQAIAALSKSRFSMAANLSNALPYNDVLIDTGNNKDIVNLAMQMIHYLKVLHKS
jgi:hypothetical protein